MVKQQMKNKRARHPVSPDNKYSLSSVVGVAGMMYGVDAGIEQGVWVDGGGDFNANSSRPFL